MKAAKEMASALTHPDGYGKGFFIRLLQRAEIAAFLYCIVSAFVFAIWIWGADTPGTSLNGDPRSTLSGLIQGTANRPFVYRALIPAITRTIATVIPMQLRSEFIAVATSSAKFQKESKRLGWEIEYLPEYCIALALVYSALLAFPFVLRSLFVSLYETEKYITNVVPIAALLGLPLFFHVGTHYLYDFPALTLFALAILFLVKRRWLLFYFVYGLGCINKETMVFASVAFALLYAKLLPVRWNSIHLFLQVLIFAVVKGFLTYCYGANAGGMAEFNLYGNIHQLLLPYTLEQFFFTLVVAALVFYDFDRKHPVLQKTAWLLLPLSVLMLFFGRIAEFRVFYEVYPIYALLLSHTIFFSCLKAPHVLRVLQG